MLRAQNAIKKNDLIFLHLIHNDIIDLIEIIIVR